MDSENPEICAENREETGSSSESNEHDYAHSGAVEAGGGVAAHGDLPFPGEPQQSAVDQLAELPAPAVGAEVDCPGGNDVEFASSLHEKEENTPKIAASRRSGSRGYRMRLKRPEDGSCCCCKTQFERQGRGFNRRAVFTFTTPDTVHWAFPGSTANDNSFLCELCAQVVRSKSRRRQSGKRSLWVKPETEQDVREEVKKGRRMGKKSKAALLVGKSCYKAAFKLLWTAKGARKPMMEFWSKQIREEMKVLSRQSDNPFHQKVSSKKPLTSFPWRHCLNWIQNKAPLVTTCLRSLFPDINSLVKSSHQLTDEQAQMLLERRAVVTLSVPLFTRNIWRNNFLQAALGAELRQQGCSGSTLDVLNTMGLCQNKDTVRLLLLRLRNSNKASMQNGEQRMKIKGEQMTDEDIEDEEEEEEDEDEEEELEEAEEEEEVEEEEDEGLEQKKKKVVVVRLGLLKGHSEVGRADLSAP
ncbi:bromo and FHA domain-containing protein DDB_G0267958-like isoform X2 [Thalassophryne amazonica]|uniref:bromo and FHA domain-containing protein DDB_G0267958-like isoform X2 n=1 Tax=Thalassophryne amazonica TaxID=390379 RepID=UPI001470A1D9|nr:bromo and FHA domain-containing protein DDB_G0267958-like isoform X2 [Thalassophryne amazonica]